MSYAVDQVAGNDSNGNNNSNSTTIQDEITGALADQLGQTTLQLLHKKHYHKAHHPRNQAELSVQRRRHQGHGL
jgi:hypothetical protein